MGIAAFLNLTLFGSLEEVKVLVYNFQDFDKECRPRDCLWINILLVLTMYFDRDHPELAKVADFTFPDEFIGYSQERRALLLKRRRLESFPIPSEA